MFDKNEFKHKLNYWLKINPDANEDDFVDFCHKQIPIECKIKYYWLIEESKAWFKWLKQKNSNINYA